AHPASGGTRSISSARIAVPPRGLMRAPEILIAAQHSPTSGCVILNSSPRGGHVRRREFMALVRGAARGAGCPLRAGLGHEEGPFHHPTSRPPPIPALDRAPPPPPLRQLFRTTPARPSATRT